MSNQHIIGRENEIKTLENLYCSREPEFLALYGRRRVGKTYLIRKYFSKKSCMYFEITGQKDGNLKEQLKNFSQIISKTFLNNLPINIPTDWKKALELLTQIIESKRLSLN